MADKIKVRRGLFSDLPDLNEGELGYVKDRGTVYIGTNTDKNILLNPILVEDDGYTLDGYLYPAVDNVHGLGTPDNRWQSVSIGPGSLHIIAKDTDNNYSVNSEFSIGISSETNSLQIVNGENFLEINPNNNEIANINNITPKDTLSINGNISFQGYTDFAGFTSAPSMPSADTCRLFSITSHGFSSLSINNEAITNINLAQDNVFVVKNASGAIISARSPVFVSGATGNIPEIKLAKADSIDTLPAIGITVDNINDGSFGQVIKLGVLNNVDTSAFSTGDRLWVSDSVAGDLTNNPPQIPNLSQRMGTVLVSGIGNGAILVSTANSVDGIGTGTIGNFDILGNLEVGGNIINDDLSETFQIIRQSLDGYTGGISETTFQENKSAQQQVNQTILQSLDGYATLIGGLDLTETQHTNQQNQINQSILHALDGYVIDPNTVFVTDTASTGDGYLAFFTSTGTNIAGDNDLIWNRETNSLGIGVSPTSKLDIVTNANVPDGITVRATDGHQLIFYGSLGQGNLNPLVNAGDAGIIYSQSAQDTGSLVIAPWTNSNHGLKLNSSGQVGIGVEPQAPLHVKNTSATILGEFGNVFGDGGTSNVIVEATTNQTSGNYVGFSASRGGNTGGYFTTIQNGINIGETADGSTPRLYIGSAGGVSGKIGIGTLSPAYTLDVAGDVNVAGALYNKDLSETFQVIRTALDGYTGGISETTFQENKNQQNQINQSIRQSLDGYIPYTGATTDVNLGSHTLTLSGPIFGADGAQTAPTYSFSGATNTGLWRTSGTNLALSVNGVLGLVVTSSAITIGNLISLTTSGSILGVNSPISSGKIVATSATTDASGITATGNGAGYGGNFTGGAGSSGVYGAGGSGNAIGVQGQGSGTFPGGFFSGGGSGGVGVTGVGSGGEKGVAGTGGSSSGSGVAGTGGSPNGTGVEGTGTGTGYGGNFTGGTSDGYGAVITGGATNGQGLVANGTGTGAGGVFHGGSTGYGVVIDNNTNNTRAALRLVPQPAPTIGEVGDIYFDNGTRKLYVCTVPGNPSSTPPVWTVVGTQT